MQNNYNQSLVIKNIIDHNIHFITQMDLADVENINHQHALRLITNAIDVLMNTAIPEIGVDVIEASRKMIKTHLIHNKSLSEDQRKKFEILAFSI